MRHRRILAYSDCLPEAATAQIRVSGPLAQLGFDLVDARQYLGGSQATSDQAMEFDAVVVHRGIGKRCKVYPHLIDAARSHRIPVILDIDDLLLRVPDTHPDSDVYRARTVSALRVLFDADTVVVSTQPLAEQISSLHSSVVVIPNEIPHGLWSNVLQRQRARLSVDGGRQIIIGYIGSETHRPDLQSIEDPLIEILRSHRGRIQFLSIGVPLSAGLRRMPNVRHVTPCKNVRASYVEFVKFAASIQIDIGIAPLLENPFNRCKSDVKFQEYAALGIAGVFSNLPTYQNVRHLENGLLANNVNEWRSALDLLLKSPEMRARLASNAARDIENTWQSARACDLWDHTLKLAAERARTRGAGKIHPLATILTDIADHQSRIERQLNMSIRYQVGKWVSRIRRKWVA